MREARQSARKILVKVADNWVAKVLSVFLAIIIFVFHRMTTLESRFFLTPLIVELPAHLVPSSSYTRMIRVTLRGDADNIMPILEDDVEAYIDLGNIELPGSFRAPVQIRKKGSAVGVEPLEISFNPVEIELELDQKSSKYVPLTANIQGSLDPGYDLVSHSLTPTQVALDGPAKLLDQVTELYTDVIDLEGRNADFSVMVSILNRDPLLTIRGNGMTEFRGFVRSRLAVRNFGSLPISVLGLDERFLPELDVAFGSVRISGPQVELDAFVPPQPFLSIDCSEITGEGVYTLPVKVDLPPSLSLVRGEPQEIIVTVNSGAEEEEEEKEELP
jgi:YbbR domain-containing protein